MAEIKIELATPSDEGELRALQSRTSMPGPCRVSYLRDPDYFKALNVEGTFHQTIIGRHTSKGSIVGWGNRSVKKAYVNGKEQNIGYLGGLRFAGKYNNVFTMLRGYEKLRQLHEDGRADFYLTTILDHNIPAQNLLTSGKRGLPVYRALGRFHSKAVRLAQTPFRHVKEEVSLRSATREDLPVILAFLEEEGRKKQFYPVYRASDFESADGLLAGLTVDDLLLAFNENKLVGVVGAWNQQAFRACWVTGYSGWLAAGRLFYNCWARLRGLPELPKPGQQLNYFSLSILVVRNDDHDVFLKLLNGLMTKYGDRYDFMMAGLHSSHPLLPVLLDLKGMDYPSRLYLVYWSDQEQVVAGLDERPVYLELGAL